MHTLELIQFLSDAANETINRADSTEAHLAVPLLDEAEELLALGSKIAHRARTKITDTRKAA